MRTTFLSENCGDHERFLSDVNFALAMTTNPQPKVSVVVRTLERLKCTTKQWASIMSLHDWPEWPLSCLSAKDVLSSRGQHNCFTASMYGVVREPGRICRFEPKVECSVTFGAGFTAIIREVFEIRGARRRVLGILGLISTSVFSVLCYVQKTRRCPCRSLNQTNPSPTNLGASV